MGISAVSATRPVLMLGEKIWGATFQLFLKVFSEVKVRSSMQASQTLSHIGKPFIYIIIIIINFLQLHFNQSTFLLHLLYHSVNNCPLRISQTDTFYQPIHYINSGSLMLKGLSRSGSVHHLRWLFFIHVQQTMDSSIKLVAEQKWDTTEKFYYAKVNKLI